MANSTTQRLVSGQLILFFIGIALAEASVSMTMVQVPIFLRELGAEIDDIGLFFTLSLIFPLLLRILGGWIADRIGRLRAIWFGSIAGALAYVPYALAPSWQVALLGPVLLAVASALIAPSYRAYIADTTDRALLGRVFGVSETIRSTAWMFGPPIGGALAQFLGYRWLFMTALGSYSAASMIFMLMTRTMAESRLQPVEGTMPSSLRASLRDMLILSLSGGLVTWLLIVDGVFDIASKLSTDLMPVYLSDIMNLSKQDIGFLDGLHGIAWIVASFLGGWLVDKTSERVAIVLGLMLYIISRFVFALATGFWGFAFSWFLLGVGGAVFQPAENSLVSKSVPSHLLGITFAFLTTSLGVFSLPFPWIGSQIWNLLGPKAPFILTVVFAALALVPAWLRLVPPVEDPGKLAPS